MKVIYIEDFKSQPQIKEINGRFEELQKLVNGYIQILYYHDIAIVCNEEGKLRDFAPTRPLYDRNGEIYEIICGSMVIVSQTENESLTEEQIEKWTKMFSLGV